MGLQVHVGGYLCLVKRGYFLPALVSTIIGISHVLAVYAFWAEGKIERFVLIDDAMISMGYARSLAEGCGLVWYCGAPKVEGYTNLGWVLYMAFWHFLGLPPEFTSLPILLTGLFALVWHIRGIYLLTAQVTNEKTASIAAWIAALFLPLLFHHLSGLEAGVLGMLSTYFAYYLFTKPTSSLLPIIAIVGTLVRMDFLIVPTALLLAASLQWMVRRPGLTPPLPSKLLGSVLFAIATAGALTLWRYGYYNAWAPNTYVLKVSSLPLSWRLLNGIIATLMHIGINLPLWALAVLGLWKARRSPTIWLLLSLPSAAITYNIYVGGDIYESSEQSNRFLLNGFPVLFLLSAIIIHELRKAHWQILLIGLIAYGLPFGPWAYRWRLFFRDQKNFFYKAAAEIFPPGSTLSVGPAGTTPYFFRQYRWYDLLGKTDSTTSQKGFLWYCNGRPPLLYFPGHTRVDTTRIWQVEGIIGVSLCPHSTFTWWWQKYLPSWVPCQKYRTRPFEDTPLEERLCAIFEEVRPKIWRRKHPLHTTTK